MARKRDSRPPPMTPAEALRRVRQMLADLPPTPGPAPESKASPEEEKEICRRLTAVMLAETRPAPPTGDWATPEPFPPEIADLAGNPIAEDLWRYRWAFVTYFRAIQEGEAAGHLPPGTWEFGPDRTLATAPKEFTHA